MSNFVVCVSLIFLFYNLSNAQINIWGPGLNGRLVMPARYFFIENNQTSVNCNFSATLSDYDVKITGRTDTGQRPCRIWTNVLDTKDGTVIVRYRLYETCFDVEIKVRYKGKDVESSPYKVPGYTYPDDCDCPVMDSVEAWLKEWECGNVPKQMINDLSRYDTVDYDDIREKIVKKYDSPNSVSLCHYVIKNNRVYRKCYGKHTGFKMFMDNILLSLTRKTVLPDTELFVNLGDWPLAKDPKERFPIFSWCGSTDSYDIVMPTYDITESTLENMGRVMLDMLSVQGNVKDVWENRIPKAFWRGRDSSRERLRLIELSREHPELFNASLTNFFFFRDEQEKYGPKADHVSFFSFFDYKYQLNLDGTVAAYRFPYLLAGGSLIFKQDSSYYEHFYNELSPNIHYIPIRRDLSDVVEKLKWAKDNDELTKEIAKNGQRFARENLLPKHVFCYYTRLLHEFSKKIVSEVRVLDGMEPVEGKPNNCNNCSIVNKKDEL